MFYQNFIKIPFIGIFKPRKALHMMPDYSEEESAKMYTYMYIALLFMLAPQTWFNFKNEHPNIFQHQFFMPAFFIAYTLWGLYLTYISKRIHYHWQAKLLNKIKGEDNLKLLERGILLSVSSFLPIMFIEFIKAPLAFYVKENVSLTLGALVIILGLIELVLFTIYLFTRLSILSEVKQRTKMQVCLPQLGISLVGLTLLLLAILLPIALVGAAILFI
tara:strand:+ start:111 stop:764 length:654 start_codon:yes stop_codon:yes gene_type:complete